jgi:hypothetical protein
VIGLAGEAARMKLFIVGGRDEPFRAAAPVQRLGVCLFDEAPSSLLLCNRKERRLGGRVEWAGQGLEWANRWQADLSFTSVGGSLAMRIVQNGAVKIGGRRRRLV